MYSLFPRPLLLATTFTAFLVIICLFKTNNQKIGSFRKNDEKLPHRRTSGTFTSAINSATGAVFIGDRIRNYNGTFVFQDNEPSRTSKKQSAPSILYHPSFQAKTCSKWCVLTTISGPTSAVTTAAALEDWCLVIVADRKTPNNYLDVPELVDRTNIAFLSVAQQNEYALALSGNIASFVRMTPYNHFARKNLGYLFAIQHGARFIFDFDDDNILKRATDGTIVTPLYGTNETHLLNARMALVTTTAFNPYPLMGASVENSWPRGFPLESITHDPTQGSIAYTNADISLEQIGILQLTADLNPDIDAIHRLTKPLPMHFRYNDHDSGLVTPLHVFTPYNAQATIHTSRALWATLLPTTVPGRVSDIWRGYFAECLFRDVDLRVAFLPPHVVQERNEHSIIGDMKAEEDLYYKTTQLLIFLNHWTSSTTSIPARMEQLWIALYERSYIELEDVQLVQAWLGILVECGYDFPTPLPGRNHHVAVMGQFNYASSVEKVQFWVQKWRDHFQHVQVRGPFLNETLEELRQHGIQAHRGRDDFGYVSPMENLGHALREYRNVPGIHSVLYTHDDAIPVLKQLRLRNHAPFPSKEIVVTGYEESKSFMDARRQFEEVVTRKKTIFTLYPNSNESDFYGHRQFSQEELIETLTKDIGPWGYKNRLPGLFDAMQDARALKYQSDDIGGIIWPVREQADFLIVPTEFADTFADAAEWLSDSNVFLECGFPLLVQLMRNLHNATVRIARLCTSWEDKERSDLLQYVESPVTGVCQESNTNYAVYHPVKLSIGMQRWGDAFNRFNAIASIG